MAEAEPQQESQNTGTNTYQSDRAARQQLANEANQQDERERNRARAERNGRARIEENEQAATETRTITPTERVFARATGSRPSSNKDLDVIYTVKTPAIIFYVGCGILLDIFDFILGITGIGEIADEIVDLLADIVLPVIAFVIGIPLGGKKSSKKVQTILIAEIAKIVPFVNIVPFYTWETWRLIALSREEDREKAATESQ